MMYNYSFYVPHPQIRARFRLALKQCGYYTQLICGDLVNAVSEMGYDSLPNDLYQEVYNEYINAKSDKEHLADIMNILEKGYNTPACIEKIILDFEAEIIDLYLLNLNLNEKLIYNLLMHRICELMGVSHFSELRLTCTCYLIEQKKITFPARLLWCILTHKIAQRDDIPLEQAEDIISETQLQINNIKANESFYSSIEDCLYDYLRVSPVWASAFD